ASGRWGVGTPRRALPPPRGDGVAAGSDAAVAPASQSVEELGATCAKVAERVIVGKMLLEGPAERTRQTLPGPRHPLNVMAHFVRQDVLQDEPPQVLRLPPANPATSHWLDT